MTILRLDIIYFILENGHIPFGWFKHGIDETNIFVFSNIPPATISSPIKIPRNLLENEDIISEIWWNKVILA